MSLGKIEITERFFRNYLWVSRMFSIFALFNTLEHRTITEHEYKLNIYLRTESEQLQVEFGRNGLAHRPPESQGRNL